MSCGPYGTPACREGCRCYACKEEAFDERELTIKMNKVLSDRIEKLTEEIKVLELNKENHESVVMYYQKQQSYSWQLLTATQNELANYISKYKDLVNFVK